MAKKKSKGSFNFPKIAKIVGIIVILLVILYCVASIYIANILTKPNNNPENIDKYSISKDERDVSFKTTDGVTLNGWFYNGQGDKVIMMVPGFSQNMVNEGYGTPTIARYFLGQGYSVLLFDMRGNGISEKVRKGVGQMEKNDVAAAFVYLESQGYLPHSIGIVSDSLGAISTIMASSMVKDSGGIVLDSPAAVIKPIVTHVMTVEDHVPQFLVPGVYFFAKVLFNLDVDSVKPIDNISNFANTPLLFLHGEKDTLIPPQNSLLLQEKVGHGDRILFANGDHAHTFVTDPTLYEKVVGDFFQKNLK